MNHETLSIPLKTPFDFRSALNAHGWVDLLPNTHDPLLPSFSRVQETPSGKVVHLTVSAAGRGRGQVLNLSIRAARKLANPDTEYLCAAVSHMLRLDENFSEFHALCKSRGGVWKNFTKGAGRLLRSPTVFEDLVKVICTTNVQWGGTKRMVAELVEQFGRPFEGEPSLKTFPAPAALAQIPLEDFRQRVRLGYRADYIHRLACLFRAGEMSAADFQASSLPTEEIRKKLLSIKGIGSYAAASMLMLLGRYDHIPVDTVFTQFVSKKYFKDQPFTLPEALALYDDCGRWKYLAYWFDMLSFENSAGQ